MIQVGIFFLVNDSIITDKAFTIEASKNEFFIEHGEHYNFWLKLNPSSKDEILFKTHSYDYYPRGRVIYDIKRDQISVFADRCIVASSISDITNLFGLDIEQIRVRFDEHYQCNLCNLNFIDDYDI